MTTTEVDQQTALDHYWRLLRAPADPDPIELAEVMEAAAITPDIWQQQRQAVTAFHELHEQQGEIDTSRKTLEEVGDELTKADAKLAAIQDKIAELEGREDFHRTKVRRFEMQIQQAHNALPLPPDVQAAYDANRHTLTQAQQQFQSVSSALSARRNEADVLRQKINDRSVRTGRSDKARLAELEAETEQLQVDLQDAMEDCRIATETLNQPVHEYQASYDRD